MVMIIVVMVKDLCELIGVGMMDCKVVLIENDGNMEVVQDWLCKKGLFKVVKKFGCVVVEGFIGVFIKGNKGVVVEVNFEIDFVVCNGQFQGFVKMIVQVVFDVGVDVEKIKIVKVGDVIVEVVINDVIVIIGENMMLCCVVVFEVSQGVVVYYVYGVVVDGVGKLGVFVVLELFGKVDELVVFGWQIVMYVVVINLLVFDVIGFDLVVVKCEKDVFVDKYCQQGKLENVIEKIVEFGFKIYYKEVCLFEQVFIYDIGKLVVQVVKEVEGKVGGVVKIVGFVCYVFGEGIEKQESDFVVEVVVVSGKK